MKRSLLLLITIVCAFALLGSARKEEKKMQTVEIRSYNLKPGTRDRFHEVATKQALPMLQRAGIDVVALGPSLHDENSYYLIRRFDSIEQRQKQEDSFYNSDEWKNGPREAIMAGIESYTTVVVQLDEATVAGLRKTGALAPKRR